MRPFQGRCHTCGHDHDSEAVTLRDVMDIGRAAHEQQVAELRGEVKRVTAELATLREKVGLAYGYLWCVNNEPCAPNYMPPDRMAYEARKLLRDTMTHDERGTFINRVLPVVRAARAELGEKT